MQKSESSKMKTVKVRDATHHKLLIIKAKKKFKDFDAAINYLADFEYTHIKKYK